MFASYESITTNTFFCNRLFWLQFTGKRHQPITITTANAANDYHHGLDIVTPNRQNYFKICAHQWLYHRKQNTSEYFKLREYDGSTFSQFWEKWLTRYIVSTCRQLHIFNDIFQTTMYLKYIFIINIPSAVELVSLADTSEYVTRHKNNTLGVILDFSTFLIFRNINMLPAFIIIGYASIIDLMADILIMRWCLNLKTNNVGTCRLYI